MAFAESIEAMKSTNCALFVGLALAAGLPAQDTVSTPPIEAIAVAVPSEEPAAAAVVVPDREGESSEVEAEAPPVLSKSGEADALALENKLHAERLQKETSAMRAEITMLKVERELISERLAMESTVRQQQLRDELSKLEAEKDKLAREGDIAKLRAEMLSNELKALQAESAMEVTRLQSDIARIEAAERRAHYADSTPVFLENPLRDDGVLVISDRRIPLNGMILGSTADFVTSRIHYWNNKDSKLPIFIVIDDCPGGSVMAGYRILKAMQSSEAPIHVVVKSFAASMAACITTLAEESYAYPNAIILHHQISSSLAFARLNLTQQREFFEESQRWWERLATPVAEKMGITTDEFIKQMYARSTSGDWSEFADQAKELKWVNHIVNGIEETSVNKDPDAPDRPRQAPQTALAEEHDAEGRPFVWLPRLNPKDCYFLYNPDGYFRMR
jgi:ATP-dependent Clp protease protease subunit